MKIEIKFYSIPSALKRTENQTGEEIINTIAGNDEDIPCILCSEGLRSNKELEDHYRQKHPDSTLYHCSFCEQVFETKNSRDYHWWQLGESCSLEYRRGAVDKIDQLNGDWGEEASKMLLQEYAIDRVLQPAREACLGKQGGLTGQNDVEKLLDISTQVLSLVSQMDQSDIDRRTRCHCLICQQKISRTKTPKHYESHDILYLHCPFCTGKFLKIGDFRNHLIGGAAKCQKYMKSSMGLRKRDALHLHDDSAPPEFSDADSLKKWLEDRENAEECPLCCEEQTPTVYRMLEHLGRHKKQLASCRAGLRYMCPVCHRFFNDMDLAVVHRKLAHVETTETRPVTGQGSTAHESSNPDHATTNLTAGDEQDQQKPTATSISESFKDEVLMSAYKAELLRSQDIVLAKWERILCHVTAKKEHMNKTKKIHVKKKKYNNKMHYSSNYKCEICADVLSTNAHLIEHLATKHGINQSSSECPHCNKVFMSKKLCDSHVKRMHEKIMVVCTICGKSVSSRDIKKHTRRHDKKPIYTCCRCGDTFRNHGSLTLHGMRKHGDEDKRRVLSCKHCSFETKNHNGFRAHMDNHNNGKPYTCKVCGDTFKHQISQGRHMKTKHKERDPIPCPECPATFVQRASLNRHKKIHEKLRYVCDVCGKIYSQTHPLMKHREKHHPDATKVKPSELLSKQD